MRTRVLVVGSGTRFLSGISYYTWHLASALRGSFEVSAVLMRQLLPSRLYPGRERVGAALTPLGYDAIGPSFDGVDWFWVPSLLRALRFVREQRPDVIVFQWWTATVGHSYLALSWAARRRGTSVVVEFHEVLDTGEAGVPFLTKYAGIVVRRLLRNASGVVVHSEFDRALVDDTFGLGSLPVVIAPHGPYGHHECTSETLREAPDDAWNILFFGTIRPYKGLEHLVEAFDALPDDVADRCWLTIVGETWEGWDRPLMMLAASARRSRTTLVNRYVSDDELAGWIAGADLVVLPYLRSSASGPLHTAMHAGLPTIVTAVGGLIEAAADYDGATSVPPSDPDAIAAAIVRIVRANDKQARYVDPQSWDVTRARYEELVASIVHTAAG